MFKLTLLFVAVMLLARQAGALPSDSEQPIQIEADAAEMDDSQGTSIYTGNVEISQGTLHIAADEVRIRLDANNDVDQIIARNHGTGSLAHFEQQPNEGDEKVFADATVITYLVKEKRLTLTGSAKLRQAQNYTEGELLRHDVKLGKMNVERGNGERVKILIYPEED